MDPLLKDLNKNLPAFTLLESLMALVLVAVSVSIGAMIYFNVLSSSHSVDQFKAHYYMQRWLQQEAIDDEIQIGEIKLSKTISSYEKKTKLKVLTIEAFDEKGKTIAVYHEIVQ